MKICFVSYEYAPFPGGGIATYHNAAARLLAEAGHEVHVVTNRAWHGRNEPALTQRLWKQGNLTIHRIRYFDEQRNPGDDVQFFDVRPANYSNPWRIWAGDPSNIAAHKAAAYIEALHREVGLDVIEAPEFFAEAFYIQRRRHSGWRHCFPPVCVHGHISSRFAFGANQHVWELGYDRHRLMMLREEYSIEHADALLTPSQALLQRYVEMFGDRLPALRAVIPYYLDVPSTLGPLPAALADGSPFVVCIGRIEPRKGSDVAMRAFAQLADQVPDLKLVLLGKPMWHQGESVDDLVAALVPPSHRGRVVRLGNVPREQALAAARQAVAFLHPVPWDNHPCAVLEAMAVGAACIVSDRGGQAEMIEPEASGLVFPAGDHDALARAVRRVLDDGALAARLRERAVARVRQLTDPATLTARKIELFEKMLAREARLPRPALGAFDLPAFLKPEEPLPPLPGNGLVVFDCGSASPESIGATRASLQVELQSSPHYRVVAMVDPGQKVELPEQWACTTTLDRSPWLDSGDDDCVVWIRAGVRMDLGLLRHVVVQLIDSPVACGSWAWLRPATPRVFPYASDFGAHDVLLEGHPLPPLFAVRAAQLRRCRELPGLFKPEHRMAALIAAAAAAGDMLFQHVGEVCGDYYGDLPLVDHDTQLRAAGYLELQGLLPRRVARLGAVEVPTAPTAEHDRPAPPPVPAAKGEAAKREAPTAAKNGPQAAAPATPSPSPNGHDPQRLAELERVYREHMALKQMAVIRWLRVVGALGLARRMFPKSRKFLGPG